MGTPELIAWSPLVAVALGALSGLGVLRSWRTAFTLAGLAILLQMIAWPVLFLLAEVAERGWGEEWSIALGGGFVFGLLAAFPYTVLATGVVGALLWLVRRPRPRL